jgi:hypothetical protein
MYFIKMLEDCGDIYGQIVEHHLVKVIFNSAMALIMEHFTEPKRSEHLGLAVGLGSLVHLNHLNRRQISASFDLL